MDGWPITHSCAIENSQIGSTNKHVRAHHSLRTNTLVLLLVQNSHVDWVSLALYLRLVYTPVVFVERTASCANTLLYYFTILRILYNGRE